MFSNHHYTINIWTYAERHYISHFRKSYSKAWDITQDAIYQELYRIDNFLKTTKAEIIVSCTQGDIIKCEFSIAGSHISAHTSGNRYIIYRNKETNTITILLVYTKDHIKKNQQETVRRKQEIKNNYDDIKHLFPNL